MNDVVADYLRARSEIAFAQHPPVRAFIRSADALLELYVATKSELRVALAQLDALEAT